MQYDARPAWFRSVRRGSVLCPLSVSVRSGDKHPTLNDVSTSAVLQDVKEMSTRCVLQTLQPALRGTIRLVEVVPDAWWWDASTSGDGRVLVDSYEAAVRACGGDDKETVVLINVAHASCDWRAIQTLKRSPAVTRVVAFAAAKAGTVAWSDRFVANCVSLCGPTEKVRSDTPGCSDTASGARKIQIDGEPFAAIHASMGVGSGSHCLAMLLSTKACSEVAPLASIAGRPYCFKCGSSGQRADIECKQCDAAKALVGSNQTAEAAATTEAPPLNAADTRKCQQVDVNAKLTRRISRRFMLFGILTVGAFVVSRY